MVRQRPAKPCTRVRFPSPPRAISSAGERFPDTEEVTGSIPVSRTTIDLHVGRSVENHVHADVAQLVAHHLAKVRVAGSNPVIRSTTGVFEPARLAQRESASLTRKRSLVQSQYRAPEYGEDPLQPKGGVFVVRQFRDRHTTAEPEAAARLPPALLDQRVPYRRLIPAVMARNVDSAAVAPSPITQPLRSSSDSHSRNVA